jgi:preprotein translocase subunit SecA
MNNQREVVYALRRYALEGGEELKGESLRMLEEAMERHLGEIVPEGEGPLDWDRRTLEAEIYQRFFVAVPGLEDTERVPDEHALRDAALTAAREAFSAKLLYLEDLQRQVGHPDLPGRLLADVALGTIDEKWKGHLYDLDQLRAAIQYRAWGQKDPLVEYKQEAYEMFEGLMHDISATFAERFLKLQVQVGPAAPPALRRAPSRAVATPAKAAASDLMPGAEAVGVPAPRAPAGGSGGFPRVGRNDPCPCGSGKKYKKCHGANT